MVDNAEIDSVPPHFITNLGFEWPHFRMNFGYNFSPGKRLPASLNYDWVAYFIDLIPWSDQSDCSGVSGY